MELRNLSKAIQFIADFIPEAMTETKTPGCSIALINDSKLIYEDGFGWRDLEESLPATPDTLYGIGSCTKAFVATAILLLAEQSKLSLDDPADRYVPFKLHTSKGSITIHHLLTHSSGLPTLSTSELLIQKGLGMQVVPPLASSNDFYRWVNGAQAEIASEPGKRFFYSNESYRMLGHIVQVVANMPFHEFVTKNILDPLGMTRSTFVRSCYERENDRMQPYFSKSDGSIVRSTFPYPDVLSNPEFSFMLAAGGLISSARDMTKFLVTNMPNVQNALLMPADKNILLSDQSIMLMQIPHVAKPDSYYGKNGYGYGWTITDDFLGMPMIAHGGSIEVSTAHVAFLPQKGVGAVILANSSGMSHAAIIEGIFASLLGLDPFEVITPLRIKKGMCSLCGSYESYRGAAKARVFCKEGMLYLEQKDGLQDSTAPLIPEGDSTKYDRFFILTDGAREPVEFRRIQDETHDGFDLFVERYRYHKII